MTEAEEPQRSFVRPLDINDVAASLVNALGGPKRVGPWLRPELKDPEAASRWVLHCLNRERREQFNLTHFSKMLRRAQERGQHDPKQALDRLAGYHPSQAMSPHEEEEDLVRRFEQSVEAMREMHQHMGALALRLGELRGKAGKK